MNRLDTMNSRIKSFDASGMSYELFLAIFHWASTRKLCICSLWFWFLLDCQYFHFCTAIIHLKNKNKSRSGIWPWKKTNTTNPFTLEIPFFRTFPEDHWQLFMIFFFKTCSLAVSILSVVFLLFSSFQWNIKISRNFLFKQKEK